MILEFILKFILKIQKRGKKKIYEVIEDGYVEVDFTSLPFFLHL